MNLAKQSVLLLAAVAAFGGCHVGVNKAYAPTKPPVANAPEFKASQLLGHYQADSPKMFLWPTTKQNAKGVWVPMTMEEKLVARQTIGAKSDDMKTYSDQISQLEKELNSKFTLKQVELEKSFTEMQCYSYCDPDDFLCDPEDSSVLFVDTWKVTEVPEEIQIIATCQANQEERQGFESEKDIALEPLQESLKTAVEELLGAIGDSNYYEGIQGFQLNYNPGLESGNALNIQLNFKFGDSKMELTNSVGGGITHVEFDAVNGYLSFETAGMVPGSSKIDPKQILKYDLEIAFDGADDLRVEGDIKLIDKKTHSEKIGRFSSSGKISR